MGGMADGPNGRWAGRNGDKDRLRNVIWGALEEQALTIGPVRSAIPNFAGADEAARLLARMPSWEKARIVKCNPDPPQIPVRLRALYDGKLVYTPVPELARDFPFLLLDPAVLRGKGVSFELAATSQGAMDHGKRVSFEEMEPMDIVVVGCVGVTRRGGRTGKGAGFADLELGIFREVGTVTDATPICTTVHSIQVAPDDAVVMQGHDSALDWIATEKELIETRTSYAQPKGVAWDFVQPDQLENIPFLKRIRERYATQP
jgi:5-formyltetrahydrofolate cyclo-ligase